MSDIAHLKEVILENMDAQQQWMDTKGKLIAANDNRLNDTNERIDQIITTLKRPGTSLGDAPAHDPEHTKAFHAFLRRGEETGLRDLEQKALSVGSDPDGGYLVIPEMSNRVIEIVRESSPLRQLATVETIGSKSLEIIVDENEMASGWVGETETRPETATAQIGVREIPVHEIYAEPRATQTLIDDALWNMDEWLTRKVGRKFARDEATAFVTGDGVKKPRGFTTYANGTSAGEIEQVASGDANLITMDGLMDCQTALKEPYHANASWLMSRATAGEVRKLKDGNGAYLWERSTQVGQPPMLLGHPVFAAADMAAIAPAALPIAFGDFREAYTIVDRFGVRVLRDALTSKPWIKFYSTKRVGGAVVNFEAIKLQVISA